MNALALMTSALISLGGLRLFRPPFPPLTWTNLKVDILGLMGILFSFLKKQDSNTSLLLTSKSLYFLLCPVLDFASSDKIFLDKNGIPFAAYCSPPKSWLPLEDNNGLVLKLAECIQRLAIDLDLPLDSNSGRRGAHQSISLGGIGYGGGQKVYLLAQYDCRIFYLTFTQAPTPFTQKSSHRDRLISEFKQNNILLTCLNHAKSELHWLVTLN